MIDEGNRRPRQRAAAVPPVHPASTSRGSTHNTNLNGNDDELTVLAFLRCLHHHPELHHQHEAFILLIVVGCQCLRPMVQVLIADIVRATTSSFKVFPSDLLLAVLLHVAIKIDQSFNSRSPILSEFSRCASSRFIHARSPRKSRSTFCAPFVCLLMNLSQLPQISIFRGRQAICWLSPSQRQI